MNVAYLLVAAGGGAAALAWFGTRKSRAAALRYETLAVPDERSSHSRPTPTGGGFGPGLAIAIVLGMFAGSGGQWALVGLAAVVAVACFVGLRDDIRPMAPLTKMLVLTATALALCFLQSLRGIELPVLGTVSFGVFAIPLTLFWLAGFTNVFNFMDGIDGIATLTAIVSAATYGIAGVISDDKALALVATVTAGASLGFLPWNFPKARIFMGDAGSLPLGLLLAYCAVLAHASGAIPFPASVLLLGPFIFDSAFTLLRRAARGERVWEAHREHLYQRLSRIWGGHPRVSLLYAAFSVVTGTLALVYRDLGPTGRLLSLGVPLAAMLAFAMSVLSADRRREARSRAVPTEHTE